MAMKVTLECPAFLTGIQGDSEAPKSVTGCNARSSFWLSDPKRGFDVGCVDLYGLPVQCDCIETHIIEQALHDRCQTPGTDIFGALVHIIGDLGQAGNAVGREIQGDRLGGQQGLVLFDQRGARLHQDGLEILHRERLQLNRIGKRPCSSGNQVAGLAQVKCARRQ